MQQEVISLLIHPATEVLWSNTAWQRAMLTYGEEALHPVGEVRSSLAPWPAEAGDSAYDVLFVNRLLLVGEKLSPLCKFSMGLMWSEYDRDTEPVPLPLSTAARPKASGADSCSFNAVPNGELVLTMRSSSGSWS